MNGFVMYVLLSLILWACARYAYRINEQLPADDPKKKSIHPKAVNKWFPLLWPVYLAFGLVGAIGFVILYILKALLYGMFLTLFVILLVFIRKPFLFIWLGKVINVIGTVLLQKNTMLINIFRMPWAPHPQT